MVIARTCFNPHRQRCDLSGGAGIVYDDMASTIHPSFVQLDDTGSLRIPESSPTEILIGFRNQHDLWEAYGRLLGWDCLMCGF